MNFIYIIDRLEKLISQIKPKRHSQDDFQMKTIDLNVEACCKMGYGPKKYECQDSYCQMVNFERNSSFFAIYDIHVKSGKDASQAANDYFQTFLEKYFRNLKNKNDEGEVKQFLLKAFSYAENKLKKSGIDYTSSGTCILGILIIYDNCYSINLGNSRAVMYRESASRKIAFELTYDHRPTRIDEKQRIIKNNGKIQKILQDIQPIGPERIWQNQKEPGITTTRALGNFNGKKIGLISTPEILKYKLIKEDQFIVLGSDGLWEVMRSDEVCEFIREKKSIDELLDICRDRWDKINKKSDFNFHIGDSPSLNFGCDDITIIVIFLSHSE